MSEVGSIFADAVRTKWMPGLNNVASPPFPGVESWLVDGTYGWLPVVNGSICLDLRGSTIPVAGALASEISRFSCAAYESLVDATAPAQSPRALGWPLVRHYYASFYCAHALLRIAGTSLTYLSSATASKLNQVGGQYLGVSPQLTAGLYFIKPDSINRNTVTLEKSSNGSGGSHEDMWTRFLALLIELESKITLSQGQIPAALKAVEISTQLRTLLCRQGKSNGAWPSFVRNAVNYRHDYGVWFPYTLTQQANSRLVARMNRWRPDDPSGFEIGIARDDLGRFAEIASVVAQLLTAALRDISNRSPQKGRSFVDSQPFKFLRQRRIAI